MGNEHTYLLNVQWTGNIGNGTKSHQSYERSYVIDAQGKQPIQGSADPVFRGDAKKWNPEEQLVGALSSCHMLSYLHLCSANGIVVTSYQDAPKGVLVMDGSSGKFKKVTLHPVIEITDASRVEDARELHEVAHEKCFIANSVNFSVEYEATIKVSAPV